MNRTAPMLLLVGGMLVLAGFGVGFATGYVARPALTPSPRAPETRRAPVAVCDIAAGTVLTPDHIVTAQVPASRTAGAFLLRDALFGRRVKVDLRAGSLFHISQIYPPGEGPEPPGATPPAAEVKPK